MSDISLTTYRPEVTAQTTGWINRSPESPATLAAYGALEAQSRRTGPFMIKDGARKYVRRPGYLDCIECGLSALTPRVMTARLHKLWNECRVQPLNYRSACLYARLLRARDSFYLRERRMP